MSDLPQASGAQSEKIPGMLVLESPGGLAKWNLWSLSGKDGANANAEGFSIHSSAYRKNEICLSPTPPNRTVPTR